MGEGSEHTKGHTANVSNTSIDSFYYWYQLEQVLFGGNTGTIRSDITGGDYELIDYMTLSQIQTIGLCIWKQLIRDVLCDSTLISLMEMLKNLRLDQKIIRMELYWP